MTALMNHFAYELKTGLRNPMQLFINYLFPLGFFAMMGLVMAEINPFFRDTMTPALAIFAVMAGTILGLPTPLIESREAGVYRSFKINGVPATAILAMPTLTTVFHCFSAAVIIMLTSGPLFKGVAPDNWLAMVLLVALSAVNFGALAALIGVVSHDSRASVLWSQLIFLPSMLLGGLMMPLDILPSSVQPVAALLPTSHAMQAILGLAYGHEPSTLVLDPWVSVGVLGVSTLVAFGLAIYLFNWDSRNQSRRGHPLMALLVLLPYVIGGFLG